MIVLTGRFIVFHFFDADVFEDPYVISALRDCNLANATVLIITFFFV